MRRFLGFIGLFVAFAGFFGTAVALQTGILDELQKRPQRYRDSLYLPSSDYVKLITLGYDHFAADYLWLRSIQTFGATFADTEHLPLMSSYFDVITDLDPKFIEAYSFGNMVVGEEGGDHEKGLALLDKGIEHNPDKYRLGFEGAFFAFWTMNDPERAKGYVAHAIKAPDCPEFVRAWEGYFDLKMGRYIAAYENYLREFMIFANQNNPQMMNIRLATLRRAIDEWYEASLRRIATEFYDTHGRAPTLAELEQTGALKNEEWPNWEALSDFLDQAVMQNQKFPEDEEEVKRIADIFLKTGWERMPNNPASVNRHFPGYLVWNGLTPYFEDMQTTRSLANPVIPIPAARRDRDDDENKILGVEENDQDQERDRAAPGGDSQEKRGNPLFVMSELEAASLLAQDFRRLSKVIQNYRDANEGQCPPNLEALPPNTHFLNTRVPEPWGGYFYIDQRDCRVKASSFSQPVEDLVSEAPPI